MGKVYLVGAGPGDPELLTLKGLRVLETADAVLYDHLANPALLEFAPPRAERIYVGKKRSLHACSQEEICRILIDRARRGENVVRLKGGDPFIFGRGGEEVEALAAAGVEFEVVPGVTAPLGIAAYAGIPLTHREHTSVVSFVTGHRPESIDWSRVGLSETLVIFMGITTVSDLVAKLLAAGRAPETPAAAVRWGTRPDQQSLVCTLAELPQRVQERGMKPPATLIIGDVVALYPKLNWFERLPLFGRRIVVTRAEEQSSAFALRLRSLGAAVESLPVIAIEPAADYRPLDDAIRRLDEYDWILFTSANGVRFFLERLDASLRDLRSLRAKVAAIGPATARALAALHLKVDLVPAEFVAEGLLAELGKIEVEGKRFLLPRAAAARDVLPETLRSRGAWVDVVEAYRTVMPDDAQERALRLFRSETRPHWVTVTSSSTVHNLVAAAGRENLAGVKFASIGPVTSATVRSYGLEVGAEASPYTVDGLIEALLRVQAEKG